MRLDVLGLERGNGVVITGLQYRMSLFLTYLSLSPTSAISAVVTQYPIRQYVQSAYLTKKRGLYFAPRVQLLARTMPSQR